MWLQNYLKANSSVHSLSSAKQLMLLDKSFQRSANELASMETQCALKLVSGQRFCAVNILSLRTFFRELVDYIAGVAPGIFRRGAEPSDKGIKYGFQGTINAKNLRKNRFSPSDGASMLRRKAIAP